MRRQHQCVLFSFEQSRREEWANQTDAERVPISTTMIYLHLINKKGAGAPSPLLPSNRSRKLRF